jgi:hypothetical protein
MKQRLDFSYQIADERLIAYSRLSVIDRLRWLDEVRRFTLMVRAAPRVPLGDRGQDLLLPPHVNMD